MWPFTPDDRKKHVYRAEEKHRRAERDQWRRQNRIGQTNNIFTGLGLAVATIAAGGAVFAAIYAHGAYVAARGQTEATKGQLDEARKQTAIARAVGRAWLDISIADPIIEFRGNGAIGPDIRSFYTVVNLTNSPAISVNEYVFPRVTAIGRQNENNWAKDACAQDYGPSMGTIVTQRIPINGWSETFLQQKDIDEWRKVFSQQAHVRVEDVRFFSLTLIVCVIYKIIGDESWHHTARIYQAGKLGSDGKTTLYVPLDHDAVPEKFWAAEQTQGGYID